MSYFYHLVQRTLTLRYMNVDIETLAKYPMETDDWIVTVLIGGIAILFSFLIVPWFLVAGYLVRDLRAGMEAAEDPPVFDEWDALLKEGFVAAVIGFIYQFIPILVFVVFVGGSVLAFLTGSDAGAGAGVLGLFAGLFISWVLAIAFGYVGVAGIANYAREGTFGAGFDFDVIRDAVTSRDYAVAWAYVIGLFIVVGIVDSVLNAIPLLGGLVGIFVSFYALIIAGWLWGAGFAEATDTRMASAPDAVSAPQ